MSNNATQHLAQTAYMDLAVNESTPVIKAAAQYGLLGDVGVIVGPSGEVTTENSSFKMVSGTDPNGFASVSTKNSLIFRPGQGEKDLFTARFGDPLADTEQFAGLINTNSGAGFGYNGTEFGILLRSGGAIEIQDLTITTPASGPEDATIIIDGVAYEVSLTAGTVQHNAVEIELSLNAQVPLWFFQAVDDEVVATALIAAPIFGSFDFISNTAVADWAQVASGVLPVDSWTPQTAWDDQFTELIPNNINNYKIQIGPSIGYFSIFSAVSNDYVNVLTINANNKNQI